MIILAGVRIVAKFLIAMENFVLQIIKMNLLMSMMILEILVILEILEIMEKLQVQQAVKIVLPEANRGLILKTFKIFQHAIIKSYNLFLRV